LDAGAREHWHRVERLLDLLIELSPAERRRVLDARCAADGRLRSDVESLLEADAATGPLDDSLASYADLLSGGSRAGQASDDDDGMVAPGERIGPFRVVRRLGGGGMGEVYLAERDDGQFEQRVALKLVGGGWHGERVVARFLRERRILASLDHPHIARLLDGGVTVEGVPYFAMEHVEGEPLLQYSDARRLGLEDRLTLFLQVCDAVAFAHGRLVVHRDLKPANVLVDESGKVKLLDFGIARVLEPGSRLTVATRTRVRWLTPEYASPEQVRGDSVSTATDVYSLGVILHEMLTGQRPFHAFEHHPHLLAQAILDRPPSRPSSLCDHRPASSRQVEAAEREDPARSRSTTTRRLRLRLRGDLDAIMLHALRKEPDQRYPSVEQMAADVRRHLASRPVAARRGTASYRTRRFVGRHRAPIVAATVLVIGGISLGVAHTEVVARERDAAQLAAARAEQVTALLVGLFAEAAPLGANVGPRPVGDFLALGAERSHSDVVAQPELRASLLRAIGRVYENMGDYGEADVHFSGALETRRALLPASHPELLESLQDLGRLRRRQGDLAAADTLLGHALAGWRTRGDAVRLADVLDEIAELRRQQAEASGSRLGSP
jgi:eukaryotic-like serine/threonine-protein kinase